MYTRRRALRLSRTTRRCMAATCTSPTQRSTTRSARYATTGPAPPCAAIGSHVHFLALPAEGPHLQVEPFSRALAEMNVDVMINGRRRDHGFDRAHLQVCSAGSTHGRAAHARQRMHVDCTARLSLQLVRALHASKHELTLMKGCSLRVAMPLLQCSFGGQREAWTVCDMQAHEDPSVECMTMSHVVLPGV